MTNRNRNPLKAQPLFWIGLFIAIAIIVGIIIVRQAQGVH